LHSIRESRKLQYFGFVPIIANSGVCVRVRTAGVRVMRVNLGSAFFQSAICNETALIYSVITIGDLQ
jgi:hypothetical protein